MNGLITDALVLRHADYSDYDRMVTLFTPDHGRIDAVARGCRHLKSPLVNCVEPFVCGEYQLHTRGERYTIDQCQIKESFYDLRNDYDRLLHGAYWLKLLEATVMPEEAAPQLFMTTLRALAHLNYSDYPVDLLTMAFEMHLMAHLGMSPCMNACVYCGRPIDGDARFDVQYGGTVCLQCASAAPRVSNAVRRIVMKVPRTKYDQVALLDGHPWQEAARLFRPYINDRLNTERFAPKIINKE